MAKKRLLWQLYPSYLLITLISLLAVTWYASYSFRTFYFNQSAGDLEIRMRLLKERFLSALQMRNFSEVDWICKEFGKAGTMRITVILPDGEVIGDSEENPSFMKSHADRPEFREASRTGYGKSLRFSNTLGKNMMYVAISLKDNDNNTLAMLRASVSVTAIEQTLNDIYRKIVYAGLLVALGAAVVSLVISRIISRPIEQMKEISMRYAEGQLDLRVPMPKSLELADLAQTLNKMARQLSERIATVTSQRNELETILSSMVEGVLAVDDKGLIVSINKAAASLLDIEAAWANGRDIEEIIRNFEIQKFIQQALKSEQQIETEVVLKTDVDRVFQLRGTGLADEQGTRTGAVIVLNDMTKLRRLEDIRRDFVANVSHELKTPITSIKGFVETLLEGAMKRPEEAERFLTIIAKHSDRLNAIIEDLLSLARLEEDDKGRNIILEKAELKPILDAAIELSSAKAAEKQITINLLYEKIKAPINAALLEQAVVNLIDNAIKYSEADSKIYVIGEMKDNKATIAVQDYGCGIEEKHLSRIFERFYVVDKARSRKFGGTGLGLAIVKHITKLHNGSVTVASSPGKGSTFTIHLPAD